MRCSSRTEERFSKCRLPEEPLVGIRSGRGMVAQDCWDFRWARPARWESFAVPPVAPVPNLMGRTACVRTLTGRETLLEPLWLCNATIAPFAMTSQVAQGVTNFVSLGP